MAKKPIPRKTYAFNFVPMTAESTLVKCPHSNDTLGVVELKDGMLEFWRNGEMRCRTESFPVLFEHMQGAMREL